MLIDYLDIIIIPGTVLGSRSHLRKYVPSITASIVV
jgi:hypothetical protein